MWSKGLFKRLVPFFVTFAAGLFIASFFVTIGAPRFGFGNRARRCHDMQRINVENDRLRGENLRLQDELDTLRHNPMTLKHYNDSTWDSMPGVDIPPPPTIVVKPMKLNRVTGK